MISLPTIRCACPADRAAIIEVINAIAREKRYFTTEHYCPTPAWEDVLARGEDRGAGLLLLLVEHGTAVVGYARLTPTTRAVGSGEIGLGLLTPYRGQGLGSCLLRRMIAWAAGCYPSLAAAILADNNRSLGLFNKFAFRPIESQTLILPFRAQSIDEILVHLVLDTESNDELPNDTSICRSHEPG